MMKFVCLTVSAIWLIAAVEAAFKGGFSLAYFGAVTGWLAAAVAARDLEARRT